MKVIYQGRQTGRTTELIRLAYSRGGYIVCHSHQEARRISREAEKADMNILFPLTYREFLDGQLSREGGVKEFYIDDVEVLLGIIARGVSVHTITLEKSEENEPSQRRGW